MFGLSETEMEKYRSIAQDYAIREVTPTIIGPSKFITPLEEGSTKENPKPNVAIIQHLLTDIETIITLTTSYMAQDYAHLQCDTDMEDKDILGSLHRKFSHYLTHQFIKYGITFTANSIDNIIEEILLELPFLYLYVVEGDDIDEDEYLEEKMDAYEAYIEENFSGREDNDLDEYEEED